MKIFYSWQSDLPNSTNRGFIKKCLVEAVKELKLDSSISEAVRDDIHVDQDTQGVPGSPDIASSILKKIDEAAVFIADITPIIESQKDDREKAIPNPNVMLELGHALARHGYERVILVINDSLWSKDINALPFDFRFRRISTRYEVGAETNESDKAKQKKLLVRKIKMAILASLQTIQNNSNNELVFKHFQESEKDIAVWKHDEEGIQVADYFRGPKTERLTIDDTPKSFMRIVPSSWPNGPVRRSTLNKEENRGKLNLLGDWSSLDYGPNDHGYISYEPPRNSILNNATQYFKSNGEVWGFDSNVSRKTQYSKQLIYANYVIKCWGRFLSSNLSYLSELGAEGPFHVEAGLTNISETIVKISGHMGDYNCLDQSVKFSSSSVNLKKESIEKYLNELKEEFADAFGLTSKTLK